MADRQRPFIRLLSREIQMRLSSGMEKGLPKLVPCAGEARCEARFDSGAGSAGTLSSNLTITVYHTGHAEACVRAVGRARGRRVEAGRGSLRGSLVQNHNQERVVDLEAAAVVDENELPEPVHEETHTRARGADRLCQHLL
jgi:hypothetical protein